MAVIWLASAVKSISRFSVLNPVDGKQEGKRESFSQEGEICTMPVLPAHVVTHVGTFRNRCNTE